MTLQDQLAFEKAFNTGLSLSRLGRWNDAVESYREAIRLRPGDAEAHFNLGLVYYELGREFEARAEFARVNALGGLAKNAAKMRF